MITIKEAANRANESLVTILGRQPEGVTVEEFRLEKDKTNWYITLSFPITNDSSTTLFDEKKWRTFKIDATTGETVEMKAGGIEP
jgi:uncharacterized membrane protein YkoI